MSKREIKNYPRLEFRFRNQDEIDFAKDLLEEGRLELDRFKAKHEKGSTKKETLIKLLEYGLTSIKEKKD